MALKEQLFIESGLESLFRDKDTGLPLANGTIEFFRDSQRNIPKPVYRLDGVQPDYDYTSLSAVITLNAVGAIADGAGNNVMVYYYPYLGTPQAPTNTLDLYYVVCKNSAGVEQWTREAWPNVSVGTDPTQETQSYDNQISNPTFTNVLTNEGISTVYTVSGATKQEFAFAPNWSFVISGTGSVTVSRVALAGNLLVPTSPPYTIDVNVGAGVTDCLLRQRFQPNSGLWGSTTNRDVFLNGSFVARNETTGSQSLQMFYEDSISASPIEVVNASFETTYSLVIGSTSAALPASTNTSSGDSGYADIYLQFQPNSHVRVSQVQVSPSIGEAINFIPSDTNTSNREQAYQGDYYIPAAIEKPIQSLLVGWDFPLNPRQINNTSVENVLTTANAYILDQTIAQKTATGGLTVTRSVDAVTSGLRFNKVGVGGAFYIAQYLDPEVAQKLVSNRMSVNVHGYRDNSGTDVTMRVYLLVGKTEDNFPIIPSVLGTIQDGGTFDVNATGWEEVPRSGLPVAQANLTIASTSDQIPSKNNDYAFSGWQLTDSVALPSVSKVIKNAAIVVTFTSAGAADFVINSVSLTPGDLPVRPPEKTKDQVLQECQRYYEQSVVGTDYTLGALTAQQRSAKDFSGILGGSVFYRSYLAEFTVQYKVQKRKTVPTPIIRSPATSGGTVDRVQYIVQLGTGITTSPDRTVSADFNFNNNSINSFSLVPKDSNLQIWNQNTGGPTANLQLSYVKFHYEADARLGILA